MKIAYYLMILLGLSACGRIETGNVGVRTDFNKTIEQEELPPGWYGALFTSVDEYVAKETELPLDDLRPKAKDNLTLRDLDVSIFYTVKQNHIAELSIKYSGMVRRDGSLLYPAYGLIERVGRGAVYDAIASFDSLTMHTRRSELERLIADQVQQDLDKSDKDVFHITKVIIRQVVTDPALEQSIQQAVQVQKQIEAKQNEVKLAQAEAERKRVEAEGTAKANKILADSLTDQYIRYKQVEALREFAGSGTHTVLLPQNSNTLVNVSRQQ